MDEDDHEPAMDPAFQRAMEDALAAEFRIRYPDLARHIERFILEGGTFDKIQGYIEDGLRARYASRDQAWGTITLIETYYRVKVRRRTMARWN